MALTNWPEPLAMLWFERFRLKSHRLAAKDTRLRSDGGPRGAGKRSQLVGAADRNCPSASAGTEPQLIQRQTPDCLEASPRADRPVTTPAERIQ